MNIYRLSVHLQFVNERTGKVAESGIGIAGTRKNDPRIITGESR